MAKRLTNDKEAGVHFKRDGLPELMKALALLTRDEVLVGVPEDKTARDDGPMTNAALAYIHDNGAPEAKIPARPFMRPGMDAVKPQTIELLKKTAVYALTGKPEKIAEGFTRVGMLVMQSIQGTIRRGIPPPLADSTLRGRGAKSRKGGMLELKRRQRNGAAPFSTAYVTPLIDTGEMVKSITYVVAPRKSRKV